MSSMKTIKLGKRGVYKAGDWVVFEDAAKTVRDLDGEEDWSHINGMLCVVVERKPMYTVARPVFGDMWPNGEHTCMIDHRHFRRICKESEVER